ncbi:MurR/RpiR family transcriptional regulator [Burkholderia multivorans]|uniref:MurR/RpiR family transcriptional regulator n=1 Tax=Burkholderia ubonensis TaxID=101571 RepID=UPI000F6BD6D6|nr:MurR/RpiR family transcriptional regulator [Burkholderia ubonensis]AYZ62985.1 MurR/RpiR family transcriptional regulator [Burkholderia multivorans]VWB92325.1 transcriptional regulator [Burkholderia ubonensis]
MSHNEPPGAIERIHHASATASDALKPVARWLASHSLDAATLTIEEVAQACGGSVASVNRFAKHAGYRGFSELKADLAAVVRQALQPVEKLAAQATQEGIGAWLADHQRNLAAMDSSLQTERLAQVVTRIVASNAVYCLGLGLSTYLTGLLADTLMPYHRRVVWAAAGGGSEQAARHMTRVGAGDTLIAISLPRYSRDTVELARFARERGAFVVALTDNPTAPLAAAADAVLLAPAEHRVLSSSSVAMVALVETLASEVLKATPQTQAVAAALSQTVLPYLVFDTTASTPAQAEADGTHDNTTRDVGRPRGAAAPGAPRKTRNPS